MAKVVKGVHAIVGEFDMSGVGTGLEPAMDQEVQEYRPWNSLAVRKEVGLRNDTATLSGVLELDDAGKAMFTRQGLYVPVSFHIDRWPAQVGDSSLFYQAIDGVVSTESFLVLEIHKMAYGWGAGDHGVPVADESAAAPTPTPTRARRR